MVKLLRHMLCVSTLVILSHSVVMAATYVDTSKLPVGTFPPSGIIKVVSDLERLMDDNGKGFSRAYAISNVGGYPLGKAYLGEFPRMFLGISTTVGCSNMEYYDEDKARREGIYPSFAPNPAIYFGIGLKDGMDLLGKFIIYDDRIYRPPLDEESATLKKLNLIAAGIKLRKNIVKRKTIFPGLFSFGGVTIGFGGDYMEGVIGVDGHYKYTIYNVDITAPVVGTFDVDFDSFYNLNIKWYMISGSVEALVYIDFLWIFNLYTGFGLSLNYGFVKVFGSGLGNINAQPSTPLGTVLAYTKNKYHPKFGMGLYIIGLEIDLYVVKVDVESMVNLSNNSDINIQAGVRFGFP